MGVSRPALEEFYNPELEEFYNPELEEFYNPENEGIYSTFLAMGHNAGPFVVLSAGLAVIKVEVTGMTGDSVLGCGNRGRLDHRF